MSMISDMKKVNIRICFDRILRFQRLAQDEEGKTPGDEDDHQNELQINFGLTEILGAGKRVLPYSEVLQRAQGRITSKQTVPVVEISTEGGI